MKVHELKLLLSTFDDDLDIVINMTNEEQEGFLLCPLAEAELIETDMDEKYIMLTGLEYHATTDVANN